MKKLIAISVMIALIAGAAFADTSMSGNVEARLNLFMGEFGDHGEAYDGGYPKPVTQGSIASGQFKLSGASDDGSMGGAFRFRYHYVADESFRWSQAFIWWKPFDQIRIWMGVDDDGMFETGQLTSWAFHQGTESYLVVHNWDFWRNIFPGLWDTFGVALSFYLVPGLDLNLVIPIGQSSGWPRHHNGAVTRAMKIEEMYPGCLQLSGGFAIPDVGKILFAWMGSETSWFDEDNAKFGKIGASFYSGSIVDGLQFQLGASTNISKSADDGGADEPISVGAAVHYGAGDFGVKFRIGSDIQTKEEGGMFLTFNIMPTYNVAGIGKICFDFGMSMNKADNDADMENGFWINPYLKAPLSGGYFQIGLMVLSNIGGGQGGSHSVVVDDKPRVYLPMVMGFNF